MSRKCAKCGIESEVEEAFLRERKSYYSEKKFYCPACWEKVAIQRGESYLIALAIILIGGLIWLIANPQNEFAQFTFQIGLLGCFIITAELIHELGHVFAGLIIRAAENM